MVNQVRANYDLGINSSIVQQQQELIGIDKKTPQKNPYAKIIELCDQTEISDEAIKLCEKDKDIQKFKNLLSSVDEKEASQQVNDLINSGKIMPTEDDLADALLKDSDFLEMIISE